MTKLAKIGKKLVLCAFRNKNIKQKEGILEKRRHDRLLSNEKNWKALLLRIVTYQCYLTQVCHTAVVKVLLHYAK